MLQELFSKKQYLAVWKFIQISHEVLVWQLATIYSVIVLKTMNIYNGVIIPVIHHLGS